MTTINDEAHEIQSPDERLVDDKNDDNNKAFAAQDNMDNNTSKSDDQDDEVEEGELPEDGEIMDDDDAGVDASIDSPRTHQKSAHEALVAADKCRSTSPSNLAKILSPQKSTAAAKETRTSSPDVMAERSKSRKRGPSSPAPDSPSYKRQTLSPEYSNALPPRRRSAWTEAVLCKFFREGHCRDGENCVYSHNAADSNRKPELCKYYQQGYCKKGLACNLLHGEYPCKAFHIGKCDKNPCKYSHVQLNDYTRPLYEQIMQDEALAANIVIPQQPAKRRTLLPTPVKTTRTLKPSPPKEETLTLLSDSVHGFQGNADLINESQPFVALTSAEDPDEQLFANQETVYSPNQILPVERPEVANGVNELTIHDMLEQINDGSNSNDGIIANVINLEDLIKSPSKSDTEMNTPQSPVPQKSVYRLIPQVVSSPTYMDAFLKKVSSEKFERDPRRESAIKKQFERSSNLFNPNVIARAPSLQPKPSLLGGPVARDPRPRAAALDPRSRGSPGIPSAQQIPINDGPPQSQLIPINAGPPPLPSSNIPVVANMDDPHFKSLIEKQLQMVNESHHRTSHDDGSRRRGRDDDDRYDEYRDSRYGSSSSSRGRDSSGYQGAESRYSQRSNDSRYEPRRSSGRDSFYRENEHRPESSSSSSRYRQRSRSRSPRRMESKSSLIGAYHK